MECPKCQAPRRAGEESCGECGVVFAKYEQYLARREALAQERAERAAQPGLWTQLRDEALSPPQYMKDLWVPCLVLWVLFVVWGWSYISQDIASLGHNPGFLHNINLPFHEAGHVIFGIFGDFIGSLGGTLGQLLLPVICGVALFMRSDAFGASICLWWFGQNFLGIAPYMADARAGQLPLLGGNYGHSSPYGFHDWEYMLTETGLLHLDQTLAAITLNSGRLIMLAAMAWGAWLLWQQWQQNRQ